MIEKNLSNIIFISQSFVVSFTKTVVYIVNLLNHRRTQIPVNGMKASDFEFTPKNPRLEHFKEIKAFYLSQKLEVPQKIMEECSDILDID